MRSTCTRRCCACGAWISSPETLPGGRGRFGVRSHMEHVLDTVNRTMTASGLNETMTYSFAEPTELERLRMPVEGWASRWSSSTP